MAFRLANAQYDRGTHRAYVELRDPDDDGGEIIVAVMFSYRSKAIYSKRELDQDLARKARQMLRKAAVGLNGR